MAFIDKNAALEMYHIYFLIFFCLKETGKKRRTVNNSGILVFNSKVKILININNVVKLKLTKSILTKVRH